MSQMIELVFRIAPEQMPLHTVAEIQGNRLRSIPLLRPGHAMLATMPTIEAAIITARAMLRAGIIDQAFVARWDLFARPTWQLEAIMRTPGLKQPLNISNCVVLWTSGNEASELIRTWFRYE